MNGLLPNFTSSCKSKSMQSRSIEIEHTSIRKLSSLLGQLA
jgi:hypothetical protein